MNELPVVTIISLKPGDLSIKVVTAIVSPFADWKLLVVAFVLFRRFSKFPGDTSH